jgi:hypothetical protein
MLTKQTKVDQCEQARVNWQTAATEKMSERLRTPHINSDWAFQIKIDDLENRKVEENEWE